MGRRTTQRAGVKSALRAHQRLLVVRQPGHDHTVSEVSVNPGGRFMLPNAFLPHGLGVIGLTRGGWLWILPPGIELRAAERLRETRSS